VPSISRESSLGRKGEYEQSKQLGQAAVQCCYSEDASFHFAPLGSSVNPLAWDTRGFEQIAAPGQHPNEC
jgi:hypothetical protein